MVSKDSLKRIKEGASATRIGKIEGDAPRIKTEEPERIDIKKIDIPDFKGEDNVDYGNLPETDPSEVDAEEDNTKPKPVKNKSKKGKERKISLVEKLDFLEKKEQRMVIGTFVGVSAILIYILSLLIVSIDLFFRTEKTGLSSINPMNLFRFMSQTHVGLLFFLMIISLLIGASIAYKVYERAMRMDGDPSEKMIVRSDSNRFLNYCHEERIRTFDGGITTKDSPINIPLCIVKEDLYCIPENYTHEQFKNLNVVVMGISGGGKTFTVLTPILLTMIYKAKIDNGDSFICTDTKGDIYRDLSIMCERNGYNVLVFNMAHPEYSDAWNMLKSIVEASEGTVWNAVNTMAETIINNAGGNRGSRENFWEDNEKMLLRGLLFYVGRSPRYSGKRTLEGLMQVLSDNSAASLQQILSDLSETDPAFLTSAPFRTQEEMKVKDSTISGLKTKLIIFQTPELAAAMSYDEIDFEEAVKKPTAIFLITSDNDEKYDVVTSLFIASLYNKLIEISDSLGGKLPTPFWFILDEICNMVPIPALSRKLSTARSRNIPFIFAIQSIPQLEDAYPRQAMNIIGNCSTWITPGVGDLETAKVLSARCGKVTYLKQDDMMNAPLGVPKIFNLKSRRRRYTREATELMPAAKILSMGSDKTLVIVATKEPLLGEPYLASDHPMFGEIEKCSTERTPRWMNQYLKDHPGREKPVGKKYDKDEYMARLNKVNVSNDLEEADQDIVIPSSLSGVRAMAVEVGLAEETPSPAKIRNHEVKEDDNDTKPTTINAEQDNDIHETLIQQETGYDDEERRVFTDEIEEPTKDDGDAFMEDEFYADIESLFDD